MALAFMFGTCVLFLLPNGASLFEAGLVHTSFVAVIAIAEVPIVLSALTAVPLFLSC